ncbi:PP2C family protein-serine/threonine phosphatase [Ancylobacter amanitiformis]|uniref:Serine/threonine protein phosphatase PrpC n=1 Tax=Ancylobacter amanitiformis TaxID=217069 RepID=A0ABU0LL77_9HYPH|nr:protein phosphatase 2C domain-containing protein [Ancylobacter amanitiformis]MDQ0509455.1 serine/threonine protein phosphatase PrpC [Ancylobacter amanitiformis]
MTGAPTRPILPWQLDVSSASRAGVSRQMNEDSFAVMAEQALFAVADGIGGLVEGAVASRAIVEVVARVVTPGASLETRVREAEDALHHVNDALFEEGLGRRPPVNLGSTIVLLLVGETAGVCLWAGDSRAYLRRGGELHQLTHDHSLCAQHGGIHPRNVITRAIGPSREVEIDCCVVDIAPGDVLLLCTDGVSNVLDDARLTQLLRGPMAGMADRIVTEAVTRGSRDDVTAVTVRIPAGEDLP